MTPPGLAEAAPSPLILQMEAAERQHRLSFRAQFLLTWAVILALIGGFLALAVGVNVGFLQKWAPYILGGVPMTLFISVTSIALAVVLAIFGALGRLSTNPIFNGIATLYVSLVRGTPLIVQIYFIYLALPAAGVIIPELPSGVIALAFNYGAYLTETFRGGIQAVPAGQVEAARSLGMAQRTVMRRVVLPQAMRIIVPPTANQTVAMLKNTSLVSVLGAAELLHSAQIIYSRTYQTIPLLIVAALWYLAMTTVLSIGQYYIERRYRRGDIGGGRIRLRRSKPAPVDVMGVPS